MGFLTEVRLMPVKGLSLNEASKTNHAGTSNRLARLGWAHKRIVLLFGVESEGWGEIVPEDGKLHSFCWGGSIRNLTLAEGARAILIGAREGAQSFNSARARVQSEFLRRKWIGNDSYGVAMEIFSQERGRMLAQGVGAEFGFGRFGATRVRRWTFASEPCARWGAGGAGASQRNAVGRERSPRRAAWDWGSGRERNRERIETGRARDEKIRGWNCVGQASTAPTWLRTFP